ncbi:hypothetical protein FSP39_024230 [Pinctada imbricata]|uniref:BEN domain-containing protein n=1 Tax=Pinctada imbricata TaxID=66713 RepID=A0AA89BLD1_PINIB|nr:hypothetical protein FSP39_024230 [Pinctada imbricata]
MYVCIFFYEDRSLSVLPRNDKNLTFEEFREGEQCSMKWLGRKVYNGTILRIDEDLDFLDRWSKKANNVVLKKAKALGTEELVDKLMSFSFSNVSGDSKRQRTETSRAKESKEQDEEMSPKKRKGKDKGPQKTKTGKHCSEPSLVEPNEMEKKNAEGEVKSTKKTTMEKEKSNSEAKSLKNPSKEKEKKDAEASAALNSSMEIFSMASQFTPMSETWTLCTAAQETSNEDVDFTHVQLPTTDYCRPQAQTIPMYDDSHRDYSNVHNVVDPVYATLPLEPKEYTSSSEPSPKTIKTLRGILDPDFQSYIRDLLKKIDDKRYQYVKLMEKSEVTVEKIALKKAISLAKKSQNPGYALCRKILPLLFTIEEMARSRGQGIMKAKEGDFRPALDTEKIQTLKDYIPSWCKTNGFSIPSEAKINEGITERIAYSRRLLKQPK